MNLQLVLRKRQNATTLKLLLYWRDTQSSTNKS